MSEDKVTLTTEQVRNIAYTAAGAASGIFMQAHPRDVMPSDQIVAVVDPLVNEFLTANGAKP